MMQLNMRKNIFNPTQTSYQHLEEEVPIRRRNHSLGSRPQQSSSFVTPETRQQDLAPINSYRKNRVQVKIQKFKTNKASTKLCQESINIYNSLKKELTSKKLQMAPSAVCQSHKPQLHIAELGLLPVQSTNLKKRFRSRTQPKCKTESSASSSEENSPIRKSIGIKIKVELRPLDIHFQKKYNQLSLREIVEDESEGSKGLNFFLKLSDLRNRKKSVSGSRRPSDDYSVSGW